MPYRIDGGSQQVEITGADQLLLSIALLFIQNQQLISYAVSFMLTVGKYTKGDRLVIVVTSLKFREREAQKNPIICVLYKIPDILSGLSLSLSPPLGVFGLP